MGRVFQKGSKKRWMPRLREAADRVRECVEAADQVAYETWQADGSIEIVEDIDIDALRGLAEAHFSEGFSWSDTYRELLAELRE